MDSTSIQRLLHSQALTNSHCSRPGKNMGAEPCKSSKAISAPPMPLQWLDNFVGDASKLRGNLAPKESTQTCRMCCGQQKAAGSCPATSRAGLLLDENPATWKLEHGVSLVTPFLESMQNEVCHLYVQAHACSQKKRGEQIPYSNQLCKNT